MLCEAYSAREETGIARWLTAVTGYPCQWQGEDGRAPEGVYWGLSHGQALSRTTLRYVSRLAREVILTLSVVPATAHAYTLQVGTTNVVVTTDAGTVEADLPGLVSAAWRLSGLDLDAAGFPGGGLALDIIDNTHYRVTGDLSAGGVPAITPGFGWAVAYTYTQDPYHITVERIQHSIIATLWGETRGRGAAKRACVRMQAELSETPAADLLLRYTGQLCKSAVLTELDRAALGTGNAASTIEVAQLELIFDGILCVSRVDSKLASLVIDIAASTTEGDTFTQQVEVSLG